MVPVIHVLSLLVFSKLFAGFLVHHLSKRLPSGMTAMQTDLMQCAAYGLSTDRLTPHLLNLCSNAGSTHTSISHTSITQPLDMTRSTCTQLLWSTMARPLLSGTCPVKPLYGLGHRAAAQFQGLGNLLIAYTIFMSNKYFFLDPQRVICHEVPCWTSSDQYERVRAITTHLTLLLPIHTWDLLTWTSDLAQRRENG